ncbi:jg3935 [Pararge aegeria aegeria]|uniref:Jg3935 protein n=1 Tax=Pararge aegeria aegeria TaxID=348720 RepID=A0A8S4RUG0_9NEOP|nr:jg3935 [Pararge aegeria aegeria]
MRISVEELELPSCEAKVAMGGSHSSKNRPLGCHGVGVAIPQRWSTPNQMDKRHQTSRGEPLDTSGPESWSLELPTKDLCPAVDVNQLI